MVIIKYIYMVQIRSRQQLRHISAVASIAVYDIVNVLTVSENTYTLYTVRRDSVTSISRGSVVQSCATCCKTCCL